MNIDIFVDEYYNFQVYFIKIIIQKNEIKILARFRPIFGSELNEKRSRAEPSQAENPSAQAMAQASLARAHHY